MGGLFGARVPFLFFTQKTTPSPSYSKKQTNKRQSEQQDEAFCRHDEG